MVVICVLLVVVFGSLSRRTFAKVRSTPSTCTDTTLALVLTSESVPQYYWRTFAKVLYILTLQHTFSKVLYIVTLYSTILIYSTNSHIQYKFSCIVQILMYSTNSHVLYKFSRVLCLVALQRTYIQDSDVREFIVPGRVPLTAVS